MIIIPAVDIKNGKCVRLLQGRMEAETIFSDDPAAMAQRWTDEGAEWIHLVDLDGAVEKRPQNLRAIEKILSTVSIPLQLGGGIRDIETIRMYFEMGIQRVIIGTEAIKNPELVKTACEQFPGRIVVGIDAHQGYVAIEGWTETTEVSAVDLAKRFENCGVAAINFTDIQRDGMQSGPNIDETVQLANAVSIPIFASGGVSSIDDIRHLLPHEKVGIAGVITGRALYEGTLSLKEAIQLAKQS
jgi:phosphoribosylformimino-5-aminoimidazole carboxamide ribotide isomerase